MRDKKCIDCPTTITKPHFNTKRCKSCREKLRHQPNSCMSKEQIREAKKLIGLMPRHEIAAAVGTSTSSLKRAFRGTRLAYFNRYVINPELVKKVCAYYERHGKNKTKEKFPNVNVRSIVERYKIYKPRQVRWTAKQYIQLARFGGLLSYEAQANYFNRPNAKAGSIESAWGKKFNSRSGNINGLPEYTARKILKPGFPVVVSCFGRSKQGRAFQQRRVLWTDAEKYLKPSLPDFMKNAISTMAKFQKWLHQSENPRPKILKFIKELEVSA